MLGDEKPVEQRPEFESILNGFTFDTPPTPPPAPGPDEAKDRWIGQVAYIVTKYVMIGAGLLVAFRWLTRRSRTSRIADR